MVTQIAPSTNPFSTGSGIRSAIQPTLRRKSATYSAPIRRVSARISGRRSPAAATPATVAAASTTTAASGPTTKRREPPKIA